MGPRILLFWAIALTRDSAVLSCKEVGENSCWIASNDLERGDNEVARLEEVD